MSDATKMVKNVKNASIKPFGPLFMTSVKNGHFEIKPDGPLFLANS